MEPESTSITFRLPADVHKWLVTLAGQSGISKHAMARTMVVRTFHAGDDPERLKALEAIEDELAAIRQALARGVAAVLQNVTDLGEETVRTWVTERMLGNAGDTTDLPDDPPTSDDFVED